MTKMTIDLEFDDLTHVVKMLNDDYLNRSYAIENMRKLAGHGKKQEDEYCLPWMKLAKRSSRIRNAMIEAHVQHGGNYLDFNDM